MTIKVVAYQCNQCEAKFLNEEQEFCSSGAAFGFHSPAKDVKCPSCGGADLKLLDWDPNNIQDLTELHGNRIGLLRKAKGGCG